MNVSCFLFFSIYLVEQLIRHVSHKVTINCKHDVKEMFSVRLKYFQSKIIHFLWRQCNARCICNNVIRLILCASLELNIKSNIAVKCEMSHFYKLIQIAHYV